MLSNTPTAYDLLRNDGERRAYDRLMADLDLNIRPAYKKELVALMNHAVARASTGQRNSEPNWRLGDFLCKVDLARWSELLQWFPTGDLREIASLGVKAVNNAYQRGITDGSAPVNIHPNSRCASANKESDTVCKDKMPPLGKPFLVRFRLPEHHINPNMKKVLYDAFGIGAQDPLPIQMQGGYPFVVIVCRPDQFVKFMYLRNARGLPNRYQCLKLEMFEPIVDQPPVEIRVEDHC